MNGACRASWKLTKGYKLSVGWMQHTVMETTYVPRFQNHKQQKETLPKTLYLTFLILQMLKLERMTYLHRLPTPKQKFSEDSSNFKSKRN